ncbi:MAG: HEAT repeat domain-containing protein [Rhabdaerophilum sp.]
MIQALSAAGHHQAGDLRKFDRFRRHPDAEIRFQVALALGGRKESEAESMLLELMEDPDSEVRDWATFGIGSYVRRENRDNPAIRQALLARLDDTDASTRAEALCGLDGLNHEDMESLIVLELGHEIVSTGVFDLIADKPAERFVAPLLRLKLRSADSFVLSEIDHAIDACRKTATDPT